MNKVKNIPRYPTGVVADYLSIKPKTLINFENAGLTEVKKNERNRRMYSQSDVLRVILILYLLKERGLNYMGCATVLDLIWQEDLNMDLLKKIIPSNTIDQMISKSSEI